MKRLMVLVLVIELLFCGCISKNAVDYSEFMPSEDNKLIIYTSHSKEVYEPIIREFELRTGIWVQVKEGNLLELADEIATRESDCDLLLSGGINSIDISRDCFDPYVSPLAEYVAEDFLVEGDYYTPFSYLPVVLIYNPKLIRRNIPDGWGSLLDQKWKGQIAFADPNLSSASYTVLCTMLPALSADPETLVTSFYINLDGRILEEENLIVNAVSDGSYHIGVTLEDAALKGIAAGCDIEIIYPSEGTSVIVDCASIVSDCEHPDNAKSFIDFLLETDVQTYLQDRLYRYSVRMDVLTDWGNDKSFVLIDHDPDWTRRNQLTIRDAWLAISREGIK